MNHLEISEIRIYTTKIDYISKNPKFHKDIMENDYLFNEVIDFINDGNKILLLFIKKNGQIAEDKVLHFYQQIQNFNTYTSRFDGIICSLIFNIDDFNNVQHIFNYDGSIRDIEQTKQYKQSTNSNRLEKELIKCKKENEKLILKINELRVKLNEKSPNSKTKKSPPKQYTNTKKSPPKQQTNTKKSPPKQQTNTKNSPPKQQTNTTDCPSYGKEPKICETKKDYFKQSLLFHPDKNTSCQEDAAEKFKKLAILCEKVL